MADGFLGRWAKRKNDALQGKPLDEPTPKRPAVGYGVAPSGAPASGADLASPGAGSQSAVAGAGSASAKAGSQDLPAEQQVPLTLDDVQGLTQDSDFKPFMNKAVEPGVRNAAMKKLFADPHFNVMDRMDIYIDDYSQPDPLPASMLRQMASAKFLQLFDEEEKAKEKQEEKEEGKDPAEGQTAEPEGSQAADNPQPPGASAEAEPQRDNHAHSHLRLQSDHAAESPGLGRGAA